MRRWLAIARVRTASLVGISVVGLLGMACKVREQPPITEAWQTDFTDGLGELFYATGDGYHVASGALNARGAHNHPLWLRKKLPRDVRIELDAWSTEAAGDIKIEIFGDGRSYDPDGGRYTATGYELIFGGWHNQRSILARLDEHGSDMAQRTEPKVIANQRYRWRIERRRNAVTWFIDDMTTPFLRYEDPRPLEGAGHEYLGFNNWETDTWFDNLVIAPL